jgi:hypothetical protein
MADVQTAVGYGELGGFPLTVMSREIPAIAETGEGTHRRTAVT